MRLSQIAQNVAVDILASVDYEIVELLVKTYDRSVEQDGVDEIYEMITEGDVLFR